MPATGGGHLPGAASIACATRPAPRPSHRRWPLPLLEYVAGPEQTLTPTRLPAQIPSMAERSDKPHPANGSGGVDRGATAEDADAEERATDEGMPEHPGSGHAGAAEPGDPGPARGPVALQDHGPDGRVTPDDDQEDDGGHDLGGEA
jgi:hypothetical protein